MLNRAHRLRRRSEFTTAVRTGRRAGRRTVVVHLQPHAGGDEPRAGFVVSRAVGGAVVRNAVRRRLRHLVRAHLADLPAGSVLVIRALPPAARASYADLDADLTAALSRAGALERAGDACGGDGAAARDQGAGPRSATRANGDPVSARRRRRTTPGQAR